MQYSTIPSDLWCWPDFADLTPEDRYYLLYLHLNPHVTICGCYPLPRRIAAAESGYNDETSDRILSRIVEVGGWIEVDADTREVLLLRWKELNPGFFVKNSNTYKSLIKNIDKIKSAKLSEVVRSWMSCDAPCKGDISPMHAPPKPHASITTTTTQGNSTQSNNNMNDVVAKKILNTLPAHERLGLIQYVNAALKVGHSQTVVTDAVNAAIVKSRVPGGAAGLAVKMLTGLAQMPPSIVPDKVDAAVYAAEDDIAQTACAETLFSGPWTHNFNFSSES